MAFAPIVAKNMCRPPRRYAQRSEPTYYAKHFADRYQEAKETVEASVKLTAPQQRMVLDAVVKDVNAIPVTSAIISIGGTHIHWLALFGDRPIRTTVGRIKSEATRLLNEFGFHGKRPWSKNCHMESKSTPQEFRSAFHYIRRHSDEGCLIHIWHPYQADDLSSVT